MSHGSRNCRVQDQDANKVYLLMPFSPQMTIFSVTSQARNGEGSLQGAFTKGFNPIKKKSTFMI